MLKEKKIDKHLICDYYRISNIMLKIWNLILLNLAGFNCYK